MSIISVHHCSFPFVISTFVSCAAFLLLNIQRFVAFLSLSLSLSLLCFSIIFTSRFYSYLATAPQAPLFVRTFLLQYNITIPLLLHDSYYTTTTISTTTYTATTKGYYVTIALLHKVGRERGI